MAEEFARPDVPGFKDQWIFRRRKKFIPWVQFKRNPWKAALVARYRFSQTYARGKRVLDTPCGSGWGTSLLRNTRTLTGMDVNPQAIAYATQNYHGQADFRLGDMCEIPFGDKTFDVVTCLEGIEHVLPEQAERFAHEAWRVLDGDGKLIVSTPDRLGHSGEGPVPSGNHYHQYEYTLDELVRLLEPYFETEYSKVHDEPSGPIIYYVGTSRANCK